MIFGLDSEQLRILDDLRDIVTGDVLVDEVSRAAYSTDASILQVRPHAIVAPKTVQEMAEVVKYAADAGLSIHPRGAGTGLAGESLGPDIVVDTSRYLRKIIQTGPTTVRVQPGVLWSQLQRHLAPQRRMFAPDPLSGQQCTIGGMLGTDAGGPHSLRYGTTRHHVHRIKIVLANGDIVEVGQEPVSAPRAPVDSEIRRIVTEVATIVRDFKTDIDREQPPNVPKPGGYCLRGLRKGDLIDLPRLLVGSEGTLALFAEAELATLPIPPHRGMILASFTTLEAAAHAVLELLELQPTACEMLDRRTLSVVRESHPQYRQWVPERAEALVLIEQEGSHEENVADRLEATAKRLRSYKQLASNPIALQAEEDIQRCWNIRTGATMGLARTSDNAQPVPFVENFAVPPEAFPKFLKLVQEIMQRHELTASYGAHAGTGILHTRPILDLRHPESRKKLESIADQMLQAAFACGGTCAGEHGTGLLRSGMIQKQFPRLSIAFRKIKAAFDPRNFLNPGRIVGAEPGLPIHRLRVASASVDDSTVAHQLRWDGLTILETADRCNGCAECQRLIPAQRMCPTYKVVQTHTSSPRTKANLMRQILTGDLDPRVLPAGQLRQVTSLCVNCKMCRLECPSSVDVSKLMVEAKAAYVAENGLERTDRFFANLEAWSRRASSMAVIANSLLANQAFRWTMEKLTGFARQRQLPRFHHRTFLRRAARNGWTKLPRVSDQRPKVAILVGTYVNHNDPHLAECLARVLERHGMRVHVPPNQRESGIAPLHYGDLDTARACLDWTLKTFGDLARDGYTIVSPEPSAVLMLRDEARGLTDHPDLGAVIERTFEASEYLAWLSERGRLDPQMQPVPISVAYHEPCHLRALQTRANIPDLLRKIPELRVVEVDKGCTGMAGTFGLRADSFDISMQAGQPMLQRIAQNDIHIGTAQCSACRMQIEQGTRKTALHPVHLFAMAYGLVQRPEKMLKRPGKGLVRR